MSRASPAKPRVLIAAQPYGEADPAPLELLTPRAELIRHPHGRKITRDELIELLPGAVAVVASTEPYDAGVLDAAPDLKLIARTGVGLDSVDLEAARVRGVIVSYTPNANSDSVAELTVGLMLDLLRHVVRADREIRAGGWTRHIGRLLRGRTVGIVGFGRIGSRVARLLAPFGCRVLATDLDPAVAETAKELGVPLLPPNELAAAAELLTIHVPLTPETRGYVDADMLARLPRGALVVNTARGSIVDEAALLAALESGQVGGAALDVFGTEPYTGPLAQHESVVLTAHMGSCAAEARLAMELGAAQAVAAFLDGEPVPDRVA